MRQNYISQRQSDFVTIRLRVPVGIVYTEQLDKLKAVAGSFGDGRIHMTVRKTLEIPGVNRHQVNQAMAELAKVGWRNTAVGDNIRNIVACPGFTCPNSRIDSQSLGLEIDSNISTDEEFPAKIKIAVSGCPNSCTHTQVNDIGIIGITKVSLDEGGCQGCMTCQDVCREGAFIQSSKGKISLDREKCVNCGLCIDHCASIKLDKTFYRILVGGKMGRHPKFAQVLDDCINIPDVLAKLEQILLVYKKYALTDERMGEMIDRIGFEKFKSMVIMILLFSSVLCKLWQLLQVYQCGC